MNSQMKGCALKGNSSQFSERAVDRLGEERYTLKQYWFYPNLMLYYDDTNSKTESKSNS